MSNQSNIEEAGGKTVPEEGPEPVEVEVRSAEDAQDSAGLLGAGDDPVQLRVELDLAQAALQEYKEKYLRSMAEVENVRRRAANDVASARKFAVEGFASESLQVRDSLELARMVEISDEDKGVVEKMKEGLDLTLRQLDSVFEKFGIKAVEPAPGDKLDPELHQAMTIQESDEIAPNHIVTVIQKGYTIHDRLLRPAMVIVAKPGSGNNA
jgi:molecular chaperone GrpE